MRTFLLVALCVIWGINSQSQVINIPDKAKEHFNANYKNATNVDWSNNATNYTSKFKNDGIAYTAHYNLEGNWTYTEKWITESAVPAKTRETFANSKYRDWTKKNVVYVENSDSEKYYRYDLQKGIKKMYVFIDKDGKVIKENASI